MRPARAFVLALSLLAALAQPALAQEAPTAPADQEREIDRTITGSTPLERQEMPGTTDTRAVDPATPAPVLRYPAAPSSMGNGIWL